MSAIHSNSIFMQQLSVFTKYFLQNHMNNHMEKTLSQMWDLMDFSQQPTLSQTASIWVKISYLTIRKADFWFGGLLKHLSEHSLMLVLKMLILPNMECLLYRIMSQLVKLQVLQGSVSFRAKFTVWLACPRVWFGLLEEKNIKICCLMVLKP